ncbi:ATP-dependent DNA helicase [Cohnella fermenti]|uniref:ATP-dependent DNA helicase n=1 Tax=Cohnella fermenti TaxID=2565925 RepID=A0A4S4BYH1_9BACL|nr:ATP-dependent DNA helicase [Cohnella fermenti]THF79602.1 ATP-dependent DNA helicase [Cohnella fermenti]
MNRYPFVYEKNKPFLQQVGEWVADVFYDILPEAGFEIRDEQIYMAYQLERAFADKATLFAEAGVGTGKTLVYLLYSVCYARYVGKPVIIACADESLIEQLVKPEGDLAKIAKHLQLTIDARLGKSPDKYLCLRKLDEAREKDAEAELFDSVSRELPDFVYKSAAMQAFHAYGDRKQYPYLNDEQWERINWDPFQDCFVCDRRHRCGQTLSRDHYRGSSDLIVCSHDFYMEHVWTFESRKREGQLPLLPDHSAVVFDEGHLLETAAQKALTYRLKHSVFESLITRLLDGEIRESLALAIEDALMRSDALFLLLERTSKAVAGSSRKRVEAGEELLREIGKLRSALDLVEEELVFESELYTLNDYHLKIVEEHLELMQRALALFGRGETPICWAQDSPEGLMLVIMPRAVKEVLRERVFSQRMPVIFSSATLSVRGSFDYLADSLGIDAGKSFSVDSPYEYAERMEAFAPLQGGFANSAEKTGAALAQIGHTDGRALLLFNSREELNRFKKESEELRGAADYPFLFEGDREISGLISDFQNEERTVLAAVTLWEGLDIPGPSLSNVIVWSLPWPPQDPVFEARRNASANPYEEVELPYMLLRLRQGIGRLIRTREDRGRVAILDEGLAASAELREIVQGLLPEGVVLEALQRR